MMLYKSSIKEARKNPDRNPHVGAWDYVDKYKNDEDVYISFTEIDKIGINPKSKFNTPVGIYTYPLKEFSEKYIFGSISAVDEHNKIYNKNTVGSYAPFAGSAKYISFIRVKDKSHFIEDMYKDYGSDKYDKDIKILEEKYKNIINESETGITDIVSEGNKDVFKFLLSSETWKNITYFDDDTFKQITKKLSVKSIDKKKNKVLCITELDKEISIYLDSINIIKSNSNKLLWKRMFNDDDNIDVWETLIQYAKSSSKDKNPVMLMWNITRNLAYKFSGNEKQTSTKWNLILSKDLGYSGFADKSGKGYIHPSEPMQAVFFNTRAFDVITRVENVPAKKIK